MKKPSEKNAAKGILSALRADLERLATETKTLVSGPRRKLMDRELRDVAARVELLLRELDPIERPSSVFDPSNPKIIGRFIALALVAQPRQPLAQVGRFYGSGVYAIYYRGDFPAYGPLSKSETPIYVGQAAPTIQNARTPLEQGPQLAARLATHCKNISKATSTLDINDFDFRMLVVQSGFESTAEDFLIDMFKPIWNKETKILQGLGKHGDSASMRGHPRSPWDTLHPARKWAAGSSGDARSVQEIEADLKGHFAKTRVYRNLHEVLDDFVSELRQK